MTSSAINQQNFTEFSGATAPRREQWVQFTAKGVRNEQPTLWQQLRAVSARALLPMKESRQDETLHKEHKEPWMAPSRACYHQVGQSKTLLRSSCTTYTALLSGRGEFIPSAAQNHTYFIASSLSGNIFSNHFPMWFVRDWKVPKQWNKRITWEQQFWENALVRVWFYLYSRPWFMYFRAQKMLQLTHPSSADLKT